MQRSCFIPNRTWLNKRSRAPTYTSHLRWKFASSIGNKGRRERLSFLGPRPFDSFFSFLSPCEPNSGSGWIMLLRSFIHSIALEVYAAGEDIPFTAICSLEICDSVATMISGSEITVIRGVRTFDRGNRVLPVSMQATTQKSFLLCI